MGRLHVSEIRESRQLATRGSSHVASASPSSVKIAAAWFKLTMLNLPAAGLSSLLPCKYRDADKPLCKHQKKTVQSAG